VTDLELIADAAQEAGALALKLFKAGLNIEKKADGTPVTDADLAVDAFLTERLRAARPDYAWLSEETADNTDRLSARRVFIVDPIDGTRAYMRGKPWWAISIAVVQDGRPVAGVVDAAALDERYLATAGGGATLNGRPIHASATTTLEGCRMLGDEKMFAHPAWARPWPPMVIESRNAIAYRMALVAAGTFDAALALSAKSEWDIAAAALIAAEAGAVVCDHKGEPFAFNTPKAKARSLICAAPGVFPLILARTSPIDLPN
jgi:myo-inositol-1(or 4)-monophosphatase